MRLAVQLLGISYVKTADNAVNMGVDMSDVTSFHFIFRLVEIFIFLMYQSTFVV